MITQDYINGYIAALNSMESILNTYLQAGIGDPATVHSMLASIKNTKDSYRELVKKLNSIK